MANYERLMDSGMWKKAAFVLGGMAVAFLAEIAVESRSDIDLPGEVYGVGSAAAFLTFGKGTSRTYGAAGGMAYTLSALATRFELDASAQNAVSGGA